MEWVIAFAITLHHTSPMNKPYISREQDNIWVGILCALEAGTVSRARVMETAKVSRATFFRKIARARMVRGDVAEDAGFSDDVDPIHLEVVAGHVPRGPGGEWYSLADDQTSVDGERASRVLITDGRGNARVRRLRGGMINPDAAEAFTEPAQPTSYKPDPRLKGGLG